MKRFLCLIPFLFGCHTDPFHAQTHYAPQYYHELEREDQRWVNGKDGQ